VAGATDTFTWDAERRLASVSGPQGTDSFVYDADGMRLMRTTPQGRTLFVAGQEITASLDGSSVTASRSYGFDGLSVATRTATGVHYLVTDQQGSVEASVPSGGTALLVTRAYAPYGQRRSGGEFASDRGWLGQIEDDTSRLSYLNARYYDPNLARFISPDPLYDGANPQSINPYAYGLNSPIAHADPDGLKAKKGSALAKAMAKALAAAAKAAARIAKAVAAAARAAVRAAARVARAVAKAVARAVAALVRAAGARAAAIAKSKMKAAALKAAKEAKKLRALNKANPDPAFWKWLAKVGPKAAVKLAKQIAHNKKAEKANQVAGEAQSAPIQFYRSAPAAPTDDCGPFGLGCFVDQIECKWTNATTMGPDQCDDSALDQAVETVDEMAEATILSDPVRDVAGAAAGACVAAAILAIPTAVGSLPACGAAALGAAIGLIVNKAVKASWPKPDDN